MDKDCIIQKHYISAPRLNYIDMVKGISIIFIVLTHIYKTNPIKIWVCSFHVPLFYIISGFLLKYKMNKDINIKEIMKSKFRSLMIPYFLFCFITIILNNIIIGFSIENIKSGILYTITFFGVEALWFLPTLFFAEIIFIYMIKKFNKIRITLYINILLSLFLIFLVNKVDNMYTIIVIRCVIGLGFLTIGYFTFNIVNNMKLSYFAISLLLISSILLSQTNGIVDLWSLTFNKKVIYIICSLLGSIAIIFLFKSTYNINWLSYIGKNSLIIMATHQSLIKLSVKILGVKLDGYVDGFILLLIILFVEYFIIKLVNNYLYFILGKSKLNIKSIT